MTDLAALAQQVADLGTATTTLTNEVVAQKDRLETAADTATTKAAEAAATAATASSDLAAITGADRSAAETAASNAATSETNAAGSAAAAAASAASAAEVTGLNTVAAAVDSALADSFQFARTEADMEAERKQNNELYAASGFTHFGKQLAETSTIKTINEGMFSVADIGWENTLGAGRYLNALGASKSDSPVLNIAGFQTDLVNINGPVSNSTPCMIKFPDAPRGDTTYDSATGVITNFSTDVDPKYGDVAADTNEAVSRAWEGDVKNGDFRLGAGNGFIDGAQAKVTYEFIGNTYKATLTDVAGALNTVVDQWLVNPNISLGDDVIITMDIAELVGMNLQINYLDNAITIPTGTTGRLEFKTKLTGALRLHITSGYTRAVGDYAVFNSVSIRKATNEVVTERVDMFGLEAFLRKIDVGTFVYPNGLIQSQATTMDGITTVDEVARPDSFFAVFDGDTGSRGLGVDFHAASAADQAKMMANPDNNIYRMENGDITQWCIRQRTVAGAGNGDWNAISSSASTYGPRFGSVGGTWLQAQGAMDSLYNGELGPEFSTGRSYYNNYTAAANGSVLPPDSALFISRSQNTDVAYNGECYFMVLGTVPRLNLGIYHPGLNEFGSVADVSGNKWYNTTETFNTLADCFNQGKISHD